MAWQYQAYIERRQAAANRLSETNGNQQLSRRSEIKARRRRRRNDGALNAKRIWKAAKASCMKNGEDWRQQKTSNWAMASRKSTEERLRRKKRQRRKQWPANLEKMAHHQHISASSGVKISVIVNNSIFMAAVSSARVAVTALAAAPLAAARSASARYGVSGSSLALSNQARRRRQPKLIGGEKSTARRRKRGEETRKISERKSLGGNLAAEASSKMAAISIGCSREELKARRNGEKSWRHS